MGPGREPQSREFEKNMAAGQKSKSRLQNGMPRRSDAFIPEGSITKLLIEMGASKN